MVEEYLSFPTNTLYVIDEDNEITTPAFTICPRPSVKATITPQQETYIQNFQNASISFLDVVKYAFAIDWVLVNESASNGETIHILLGENFNIFHL